MRVYLGSDHRGFSLKEKIKDWLASWGFEAVDLGAESYNPKDDYSLYAEKVGSVVAKEGNSLGILLCGSGIGVDIVANKIDGVRASIGKSPDQVKAGRNDDDMNVLVIAADYTKQDEVRQMVEVFLKVKFSGKERFVKRLEDISRIEKNN